MEEGWLDRPETKKIAKHYLNSLKQNQIDTLVLACTHYPLIRNVLQQKIGKRVKLVDPAEEVVKGVKEFLKSQPKLDHELARGAPHQFYMSDVTDRVRYVARDWLGQPVQIEKMSLE